MEIHYPTDKTTQILIALLKAHGIKYIVASPGTTNAILVAGLQSDPFFKIFSSVDERSAAYLACGIAQSIQEPVVITCTEATASRNYFSGLTEAFYRKLPILVITGFHSKYGVGNLCTQAIDRSQPPKDSVRYSAVVERCKNKEDEWHVNLEINRAILELTNHGGGPVHIDMQIGERWDFFATELPLVRVIKRISNKDEFPPLPKGRIAIVIGAHVLFSKAQTMAIENFCEKHDAVVITDLISNYYGKYSVSIALTRNQKNYISSVLQANLRIHIGEIGWSSVNAPQTWRISDDGAIRDPFHDLTYQFDIAVEDFFNTYADKNQERNTYLSDCQTEYNNMVSLIKDLPYSNAWLAYFAHRLFPNNSVVHFGILNSFRVWNLFEIDNSVETSCNFGGFGIDGGLSTLIGSSLVNPQKIHFGVFGDLAFFYDMNVLGNRHVGNNIRIILVNNGRGNEFRNSIHPAYKLGPSGNDFVAAAGHFGNQSTRLVRHYAEDLGYVYASAKNKEEFKEQLERTQFFSPNFLEKPIILEVFTEEADESLALEQLTMLKGDVSASLTSQFKKSVKNILGDEGIAKLKSIMKK